MSAILLPLDGRPCNTTFPVALAELADVDLRLPPLEWLGNAQQTARQDRLSSWFTHHVTDAKHAIVSLDTWLYGNLVASRKSTADVTEVLKRLECLRDVKAQFPELQLHGFATLLRLSNSHDDTEERPYWAQWGKEIYRYAFLDHYLTAYADTDLSESDLVLEYKTLQDQIPAAVLSNYRELRKRNLTVLEHLIEAVSEGWLSQLLIGCDDGGAYGWTRQERAHLQTLVTQKGLNHRVLIYPGADELACVLLARALRPEPRYCRLGWTYPEAQHNITRYEGLPLDQTVAAQARAVGIEFSEGETLPLLWLHNPPHEQIDQFLDRESRVESPVHAWEPLVHALKTGEHVALADICYANGGDVQLLRHLEAEQLLFHLSAYGAWNTVGNTLGFVFAWIKMQTIPTSVAQRRLLAERLADDGWYQGYLRQQLCADYRDPVSLNSCVQGIAWMNQHCREWQSWMPDPPAQLEVLRWNFPWRRFFEIELRLCFKMTSSGSDEAHCDGFQPVYSPPTDEP